MTPFVTLRHVRRLFIEIVNITGHENVYEMRKLLIKKKLREGIKDIKRQKRNMQANILFFNAL